MFSTPQVTDAGIMETTTNPVCADSKSGVAKELRFSRAADADMMVRQRPRYGGRQ